MGDWFVGEIRAFPLRLPPSGWLPCQGASYPTDKYPALFRLLGYKYGGSGNLFKVPDFRGRVLVSPYQNQSPPILSGSIGGTETVALSTSQLPTHSHNVNVVSQQQGNTGILTGHLMAQIGGEVELMNKQVYYGIPNKDPVALHSSAVGTTGGSAPHNNMQPFLVLLFAIAADGIYPVAQS